MNQTGELFYDSIKHKYYVRYTVMNKNNPLTLEECTTVKIKQVEI